MPVSCTCDPVYGNERSTKVIPSFTLWLVMSRKNVYICLIRRHIFKIHLGLCNLPSSSLLPHSNTRYSPFPMHHPNCLQICTGYWLILWLPFSDLCIQGKRIHRCNTMNYANVYSSVAMHAKSDLLGKHVLLLAGSSTSCVCRLNWRLRILSAKSPPSDIAAFRQQVTINFRESPLWMFQSTRQECLSIGRSNGRA